MNTNDIRKKFIEFFKDKNHVIFPGDLLVPSSDPTLLFTSAGMVQFKNYFLGKQKLKGPYQRAASIQKCFRTSDIERVGLTARHLTFFEMLGNFSFGDYFKRDAIQWAWEFLTEEIKLEKEKLYVSVYKNDTEAYELWSKIIPINKIVKLDEDSNFWQMGDTGPCGPCSEILYDTGAEKSCGKNGCGPGCDCDRYIEIWNLVFTQFDKQPDGTLTNLPQKNIDTGMGLERLASVKQKVNTNFETDEICAIINFVKKLSDVKDETSQRIIADHSRAVAFLIADGILPSNEGRGYVLRRVIRRAMTYGRKLELKESFLSRVCDRVIDIMKDAYPDIAGQREHIIKIVKMEEEKFIETLNIGKTALIAELNEQNKNGDKRNVIELPGKKVFYFYDTIGLPPELQKEIFSELGVKLKYDESEFALAQQDAHNRSKASWRGSGERDMGNYFELQKQFGDTIFRGYEENKLSTEILAIVKDGKIVNVASAGEIVELILKETVFYGESGGQIGDSGKIIGTENSFEAEVLDTQKPVGNLVTHKVEVKKGAMSVGSGVEIEIDLEKRKDIMKNHTATHILHKALRSILGKHALQRGSLVADTKFRFDFLHPAQVKKDELNLIEEFVNKKIIENYPVETEITTIEEAKALGAMALFGEKYGEKVRCVIIGGEKKPESIELCGGTHCRATGEIGQFIILSETSVGSGMRRIEGCTGIHAYHFLKKQQDIINNVAELLKSSESDIISRLTKNLEEKKKLEKETHKAKGPGISKESLMKDISEVNGIKIIARKIDTQSLEEMRGISDMLKNGIGSGVVAIGSIIGEKPVILISVTKDLVKKINAGTMARELSAIMGGGGGGRPDFAQAGGKNTEKLDEAINSVKSKISDLNKSAVG